MTTSCIYNKQQCFDVTTVHKKSHFECNFKYPFHAYNIIIHIFKQATAVQINLTIYAI